MTDTSEPLQAEGLQVPDESRLIAEEGYSISGLGASQLAAWLRQGALKQP